jgi:hypothetical protein
VSGRKIRALIERSSLGDPIVKVVRARTPYEVAAAIVEQAERVRISTAGRTYQFHVTTTQPALVKGANQESAMGKKLTPGTIAPRSGQYQERGPRGGAGREVTVVRGERMPPTTQPGSSYTLVDPTKNKSGSAD